MCVKGTGTAEDKLLFDTDRARMLESRRYPVTAIAANPLRPIGGRTSRGRTREQWPSREFFLFRRGNFMVIAIHRRAVRMLWRQVSRRAGVAPHPDA